MKWKIFFVRCSLFGVVMFENIFTYGIFKFLSLFQAIVEEKNSAKFFEVKINTNVIAEEWRKTSRRFITIKMKAAVLMT